MRPHEELEREFAAYIGTEHAVAVNTGTAALHLALVALGIGPGDEVIVPDFTMAACAYAVLYTGATPVYVDCGADLNIDVAKAAAAITDRTKAIMPVHVYGRACNMSAIVELADNFDLAIVEDVSEAHGGTFGGYKLGAIGTVGCFSLYRNKIIHAEEGGIITTNDAALAEKMRDLKNMAFGARHDYQHTGLGFNYRMTDSQAALALASLENAPWNIAHREAVRVWYDEVFGQHAIPRSEGSVIWQYDFILGEGMQDEVVGQIPGARHFFKPMSTQPFSGGRYAVGPNARQFASKGIYLPVREDMDREEVDLICKAIKKLAR